jgi:hypothetical protein
MKKYLCGSLRSQQRLDKVVPSNKEHSDENKEQVSSYSFESNRIHLNFNYNCNLQGVESHRRFHQDHLSQPLREVRLEHV